MSSIVEKVETFIQRLHDLDYVVALEASEMWYTHPSFPTNRKSLKDNLANAIFEYEEHKDGAEDQKLVYAQICLLWINRAFASGVIREGQGLARKLKECQERKAQLEKDLDKISVDYLNLKKMQDEFHKYVRLPNEDDSGDENEQLP